jgi:hypothetical protein
MKERVKQLVRYEKWKRLFEKYERVLIPVTLVFGVIVDFVTFRSIRIETTFLILGAHLIVAGASIVILNISVILMRPNADEGYAPTQDNKAKYLRLIAPLTLQFSFGALLSASLIFYWFSGTFSVSWPLLILIAVLMTSNEVLRQYYLRPIIQISIYYFILFSLATLVLPFALNSIDVSLFIYAGFGSLIVIGIFVAILSRLFVHIRKIRPHIAVSILSVFVVMNALYFFNIIPPIPLSLREAGVYHDIKSTDGTYQLTSEREILIDKFLPGQTIHLQKGKRVYVYSAIFAPTKLNTTIFHQWQFFDEEKNEWIDKDRLSYAMAGGRDEGYRGYSLKTIVVPGKWRVSVETGRGQALGRVGFKVVSTDVAPELIREER